MTDHNELTKTETNKEPRHTWGRGWNTRAEKTEYWLRELNN